MAKKILVVDDDVDLCTLLAAFLEKNGFEVSKSHSMKGMTRQLQEQKFNLVLCDFRLGDADGRKSLDEIQRLDPDIPVIIITGYSDVKTAVSMIKIGAFDYVAKPLIPEEILSTINRALSSNTLLVAGKSDTAAKKKNALEKTDYIIGESSVAKELYRQIDLVAPTNYSVIIYGESGSGKEAVARSIHAKSKRRNYAFVALDCGAISRELAGSELFGHEKGSFTGALSQKIGHFELANGGTLFLDEVANLSFDVQTSLLRVVQEQRMKRIGGLQEIKLDTRILVASNENLMEAHRKGKFREDLFHRFNEFSIYVPPLRERREDIPVFAQNFLRTSNSELGKNIQRFDDQVLEFFQEYNWPGNIRELKNVIKRAALLCDDNEIHTRFLPAEIINPENFNNAAIGTIKQNSGTDLKSAAMEAEYDTILKVLKEVNYNKSKAARLLNIDRKTLYNKLKTYNL